MAKGKNMKIRTRINMGYSLNSVPNFLGDFWQSLLLFLCVSFLVSK